MGKPLFCSVNQSLGQNLAYSKGIFFHSDAYVFKREKTSLCLKNKKDLERPFICQLKHINAVSFILLPTASAVPFTTILCAFS